MIVLIGDTVKFKTGTKSEVLQKMAYYAIRDQQALIDALTPGYGEPDEETANAIQSCKDVISDFARIYKEQK